MQKSMVTVMYFEKVSHMQSNPYQNGNPMRLEPYRRARYISIISRSRHIKIVTHCLGPDGTSHH